MTAASRPCRDHASYSWSRFGRVSSVSLHYHYSHSFRTSPSCTRPVLHIRHAHTHFHRVVDAGHLTRLRPRSHLQYQRRKRQDRQRLWRQEYQPRRGHSVWRQSRLSRSQHRSRSSRCESQRSSYRQWRWIDQCGLSSSMLASPYSKRFAHDSQFNGGRDGAGPLRAFLDTTGTGNNFKEIRVSKNVGDRGAGSAQGFTIVVPPSTSCANGVCLLKAANPAGPFGSCFAVAPPKGGAVRPFSLSPFDLSDRLAGRSSRKQ